MFRRSNDAFLLHTVDDVRRIDHPVSLQDGMYVVGDPLRRDAADGWVLLGGMKGSSAPESSYEECDGCGSDRDADVVHGPPS